MTHRQPEVFKNPPHRPNFMLGLQSFIIWSSLTFMLLLVLLPLIWMILTALKQQGRAFDLTFIPSTVLSHPADGDGLPLARIGVSQRFLHIEIEEDEALTMVAIVSNGVGVTERFNLNSTGLGFWSATVGPLDQMVALEIEADGKPATNLLDETLEPDDSIPMTLQAGPNDVGGRRLMAWLHSDELFAVSEMEGFDPESIVINDQTINFGIAQDGVIFEDSAKELRYKVQTTRSFGEAIASLYTFKNFMTILNKPEFNFGRYFLNSLIVATSAALLTVLIVTLAGYAFAQKHFHYRDAIFYLLLSSMLVPGMIYMVPQFSITLKLGWLNSFTGMVVPHLANVFGLFLLRQYIEQIPKDLFCAAEIDGANDIQIFKNIVIPMTMPVMVTLFLLVFVGQWSNFLWQLIVNTGDQRTMTLPVGLQQFRGQNATDWELIMAGACFSILPITVIFLSLQRYFIMGLTAGSVKE